MTKIQDKLQMMYIDKNGKVHEKTFTDSKEANAAFTILNKNKLPIATKKGLNSAKLWNSNDIDWLESLIKTGGVYWHHSLGYELLSDVWEITVLQLDIANCEEGVTDAYKVPLRGKYYTLTEEVITVSSDFPTQMMHCSPKYTKWTFYEGEDEMVSFARPELTD